MDFTDQPYATKALLAELAKTGVETERRAYSHAHEATVAALKRRLAAARPKPQSFGDLFAILAREIGLLELGLAGVRGLAAPLASAETRAGTVRVPTVAEGPPLLWAGDLVIRGDLENGSLVVVTGDLTIDGTYRQWRADAPLLVVGGDLTVGSVEVFGPVLVWGDLAVRTMYAGGPDHRLDVGGRLEAELLVQHEHEIGAGTLAVTHHLSRPPAVYDARGRLDLEAILARLEAGRGLPPAGEDDPEDDLPEDDLEDEDGLGAARAGGAARLDDAAAADEDEEGVDDAPTDAGSDAELLLRRLVRDGQLELEKGIPLGLLVPTMTELLERARSPEHAARQIAAWLEDHDAVVELYIGDRELEALIRDTLTS
jgi:hypothetical protein